jgi:hypothetical protein
MHEEPRHRQRTRRILKATGLVAATVLFFFFVPFVPMTTANFGGGPNYTALVSLSFALFQCGDYVGHPGIQVPNGGFANPYEPFASFWNCDYPHL